MKTATFLVKFEEVCWIVCGKMQGGLVTRVLKRANPFRDLPGLSYFFPLPPLYFQALSPPPLRCRNLKKEKKPSNKPPYALVPRPGGPPKTPSPQSQKNQPPPFPQASSRRSARACARAKKCVSREGIHFWGLPSPLETPRWVGGGEARGTGQGATAGAALLSHFPRSAREPPLRGRWGRWGEKWGVGGGRESAGAARRREGGRAGAWEPSRARPGGLGADPAPGQRGRPAPLSLREVSQGPGARRRRRRRRCAFGCLAGARARPLPWIYRWQPDCGHGLGVPARGPVAGAAGLQPSGHGAAGAVGARSR